MWRFRKPVSGSAILIALLFLILPTGWASTPAAPKPLILAIHPYLPATEVATRFGPFARYLEKRTGHPVKIQVSPDYASHIDAVGRDQVDIAYMGPGPYVRMVESYGAKPILARLEVRGKPTFHGYIVKGPGSPLETLSDLRGKRFAFGDPASTMSHLVPRSMLIEAGIRTRDLESHEFLDSHRNVALGVLAGDFDAGAVKEEVYHAYRKRGLEALAETPAISEHMFVATGRLSSPTIDKLREAHLALAATPKGPGILARIKKTVTALVPATDEDYANLRRIMTILKAHGIGS